MGEVENETSVPLLTTEVRKSELNSGEKEFQVSDDQPTRSISSHQSTVVYVKSAEINSTSRASLCSRQTPKKSCTSLTSGEEKITIETGSTPVAKLPLDYFIPPRIDHPLLENVILSAMQSCVYYLVCMLFAIPVILVVAAVLIVLVPIRLLFYLVTRLTLYGSIDWLKHPICDPQWPLTTSRNNLNSRATGPIGSPSVSSEKSSYSYCVLTIQGCLELSEVRGLILKKVLHCCDANGYLVYPHLTQRLSQECCGVQSWCEDQEFDIQNHVMVRSLTSDSGRARKVSGFSDTVKHNVAAEGTIASAEPLSPASGVAVVNSLKSLENYLNGLCSKKISFKRPPWELEVIPDFGESRCTLLILRFYSAVTENLCFPRLVSQINDSNCSIEIEPKLNYTAVPFAWSFSQALLLGPADLLYSCLRPSRPTLGSGVWEHIRKPNAPNQHVLTWARVPNIEHLTRLERLLHCTTVELFLAFVAGALRSHLRANGVRHPPDFEISIPISLVDENDPSSRHTSVHLESAMGFGSENQADCHRCNTVLIPLKLPVGVEGCVPRIWEVQRRLADALEGPKPYATHLATSVFNSIMPQSWTKGVLKRSQSTSSCVVSFYRASVDLSVRNHRIHSILLYNSICPEAVYSAFNFIQVGREVVLSLSVNPSVFPDPDGLLVKFQSEIQNLLKQVSGRLFTPITAALLPAAIAVGWSYANKAAAPSTEPTTTTAKISDAHRVSPTVPSAEVSESSLEELESLLETVQSELQYMRENPVGNHDSYLAKLTQFEARMEALQNIIAQKLQMPNSSMHSRTLSTPAMTSTRASSPVDNVFSDLEGTPLYPTGVSNVRLKRKRSRRTSSPTAVRAKVFGANA